jgi:hypothetical protein
MESDSVFQMGQGKIILMNTFETMVKVEIPLCKNWLLGWFDIQMGQEHLEGLGQLCIG